MPPSPKYREVGRTALSNIEKRHVARALRLAELSTMRSKHGAVLVQGGKVLSVGVNTQRNEVAPHIEHQFVSDHAEANALRGYGFEGVSKMTLYVARIDYKGDKMYSKPCIYCQHMIRRLRLKAVIHT